MGVTKNALIRYQTLDRCFRNPGKRYYIEDLLEACNNSLFEHEPNSEGIRKRQLYDDFRYMESSQGWSIPLERYKEGRRVYFRYDDLNFSINNQPINENEAEQLKSAMLVLRRFKGLPQFEWVDEIVHKLDQSFNLSNKPKGIISFETNEFLKGVEFISPLFNAILYSQTLKISYQSFKSDEAKTIIFYPYHLKQYNNRWFLFGKNKDYDNLTNLGLERINSIENSKETYIPNTFFDFDEYFEDFIGVTKSGEIPTKIILFAKQKVAPYIKTKPLHGSQKKIEDSKDGFTFLIEVIPNIELENVILSFGEDLIVKSPEDFKIKILERIKSSIANY